jgi:hypothetical protein
MARSLVEMISFNERSEMAYAGRSTIWALLSAVRGQSELPGRKALIYFSEGFAIPQGAEEEFQAVISAANRNNLSFYPIDARGLTSKSLNAKATEGLSAATTTSALSGSLGTGGDLAGLTQAKTEIALSMDLAINANRMNIQDTLAMLADQTGGFPTANTNDFRAPLERVMQEIDTYYELSYNPHVDKYDGKFRRIEVKLDRSDLAVQSRSGYFALPPDMLKTSGLNSYEVPLLRALSDMLPNRALPFESGGMHFRGEGRFETCGFLIDMPLSSVTLRENRDQKVLTGLRGPDQGCEGRGSQETARRDAGGADSGAGGVLQAGPLCGYGVLRSAFGILHHRSRGARSGNRAGRRSAQRHVRAETRRRARHEQRSADTQVATEGAGCRRRRSVRRGR